VRSSILSSGADSCIDDDVLKESSLIHSCCVLSRQQRCDDFLDPRPSTVDVDVSSWTRVQQHEFCLKDETCAKKILKVSSAWEIDKKPEWCLLVVEAFRVSCIREHDNVIKKMFSNEKNASMIFNDWRIFAMNGLRERNSMKGTPELFLLIAIVGIIADCRFIDSEKRLHIISSRGVDWQVIVNEVRSFYRVDQIKIDFRESPTHRFFSPSVSCLLHKSGHQVHRRDWLQKQKAS
jgi:hypothetical protein